MGHIGIYFTPYKNEFVYSWICRLARANGLSFRHFMVNYMGHNMIFRGDFKYELRHELTHLAENSFRGLDLDDIYKDNTGRRFYNLFLTEMQIEKVNQNYVKDTSNLNLTVQYHINHIRVCPECLKEDECKILHVEHQIPEATVCAKHGCKLMEFTKQKGYEYEFKESDYQEVPYKFDEDTDFMLSKYIADLCLSDITACITDVKQAVVDKLRERGYLRTWNDTAALLTDIGAWKYKGLFQGREEYFANKIFPRKINIAPEGFLPFMIFAFPDVQDLIRVLPRHEQYFERRCCSVCGKESIFTVLDKSICYECVKKDDENHEFARLIDKMSDGEYKAMSEFESLNNEVALLHKECGNVVHIKPRMFLYGTSRCPCEKVEFDNSFKILKAYQNTGMSIDDIIKTTVWNGYKLGQWVSCTRRKAGKNVLTNKQMAQLEEIGFTFEKSEKKWIETVEKYRRYVLSTGIKHVQRPIEFENFRLGQWYADMRQSYRKGCLSDEKLLEIREINPDFPNFPVKEKKPEPPKEKKKVYFDEAVELFLEYRKEYNTQNIQKRKEYKGYKLGIWANQMRAKRKQGILPAEQIERLNEIDFDWNPLDTKWNEDMDRYRKYIQSGGKLEIPKERDFEGFAIGYWYANLKISYRNGSLTKDKIQEVRGINSGFMNNC